MSVATAPVRCAVESMTEVAAQARSGLMAVHGRDTGRPRRLELDVATAAAKILAAQGARAVELARLRGIELAGVATSALDGALLFVAHHVAIATSGDPLRPAAGSGHGPPFLTADGHRVELEALSPGAWSDLWERLGVGRDVSAAAWSPFVLRYLAGSCALPPVLHEATARHDLAALREAAAASGVELCRQRTYAEVLADPQPAQPWTLTPVGDAAPAATTRACAAATRAHAVGPAGVTSAPPAVPAAAAEALTGVVVVELATRLQGPLAGHLLRLLGARVVKVEPPGGDIGRRSRAAFGWAAYQAYNAGKEIVELDVKSPAGRGELRALAATADVFVHNSPPGRAERLGFDAAALARVNPALVHAHASGWGTAGPTRIAGDFLVQAHAGCADGLTRAGELPRPSRVTLLDVTGGLLACDAILAGLVLRERGAGGCAVQTSLLAAAGLLQRDVLRALAAGRETGRRGGRALRGPLDEPLRTADGWLVVPPEDLTVAEQAARADGMGRGLKAWLRERDSARARAELAAAGACAVPVREDLAALADDESIAGRMRRLNGGCLVPAPPWRFDRDGLICPAQLGRGGGAGPAGANTHAATDLA